MAERVASPLARSADREGLAEPGDAAQVRVRVHCSYHKCLTVYFRRVVGTLLNRLLPLRGGHRHFNSDLEAFRREHRRFRVSSINNRALDPDELAGADHDGAAVRITRFVRDPRDLVVSGYFYHRRGAEPWTRIEDPTPADWEFANGVVPEGLRRRGGSFAAYLQQSSLEEGLLAELEFRREHFRSMASWPERDPRVRLWRYEEILGDEARVFGELLTFLGLGPIERRLGVWLARRASCTRVPVTCLLLSVRVPQQWKRHFTPRVHAAFLDEHRAVLEQLGYPVD